jgi:hypothetical protein
MSTVRHVAAWTYRILITRSAAPAIVEVFVPGPGVFDALPGESKPVSQEAFDDQFGVHAAIGARRLGP